MAYMQPSAAGVEHYREAFDRLDCYIDASDRVGPVSGPRERNLHLGGTPIAMTLAMVGGLIDSQSCLWKIAERSPDSMEYEVASTMLLMSSWPEWLVQLVDEWGWLDLPLIRWKDVLKPHLIAIRRMGMAGAVKSDEVYCTRKLINTTYRRDTEADWEKEKANRLGRDGIRACCLVGTIMQS